MNIDLTRILESKRVYRSALTARPIGEKLRLLDDLRQLALDIRGSQSTSSLILRKEPAFYGAKKP